MHGSVAASNTACPEAGIKRSENWAVAMKTTSCGILICTAQAELLLCHATGGRHWDIPKGAGEAGESPLATARRETAEECGLLFAPADLLELGHFAYRPAKDLHLYAALTERLDTRRCHCSTGFRDRFGRELPEMDAFAWVPFGEVPTRCAKSMAALLGGPLALAGVLQRLQAEHRIVEPRWAELPGLRNSA